MSRHAVLNDAQWEQIAPLLPSSDDRQGQPFRDHRQVVEGIVYRYRTGIAWRDLPVEFGPWQTVWKRHKRFSSDGTWDNVLTRLLVHADAEDRIDWAVSIDSTINRAHQHAATLPLTTGGHRESHESGSRAGRPRDRPVPRWPVHQDPSRCRRQGSPSCRPGRPRSGWGRPDVPASPGRHPNPPPGTGPPPDSVLADKAYSSRAIRTELRRRGITAVIPEPRDQQGHRKRRGRRGGRPVTYDTDAYEGRNVVERSFNALKHWRGLATRYDKLAVIYRGGAVLAAILAWLRTVVDDPSARTRGVG